MSDFWSRQRVVVTGGAGFVGSHVVERLIALGSRVTVADHLNPGWDENLQSIKSDIELRKVELCNTPEATGTFQGHDVLIHMAAKVAGIGYNQTHPAEMFMENAKLNLSVLEAARQARVPRVEVVSSACVYPRECRIPTPEDDGFIGDPEPTNLGYGWAKRILEVQARLYATEYGMAIGVVRPYNTYGPRDNFAASTSHVIASLISRVMQGEDPLVVWGSGEQSRAFLYVEDCAQGILDAAERYPVPDPVNLGTTEEVTIKSLISMITELCDRHPKLQFDVRKPSGQPRRNCDTTKAEKLVGFKAGIPLREGLRRTITWYRESYTVKEGSCAKD